MGSWPIVARAGFFSKLLIVVAQAVAGRRHRCPVGSLQGYAISLGRLRRQVDPHWQRGMSFLRIGLALLQQCIANAKARIMAWMPIPLQQLETCIPSRSVQRRQKQPWFTRIDLPPRPHPSQLLAVA